MQGGRASSWRHDLALVLAAHNAGEKTVELYQGVPAYAQTRQQMRRILRCHRRTALAPFVPGIAKPSELTAMGHDPKRVR